jgi:hypothetical protein
LPNLLLKLARTLNASTRAAGRYKEMREKSGTGGSRARHRQRDALIAAVIQVACQKTNEPLTTAELRKLASEYLHVKDVGKSIDECRKVLDLGVDPTNATDFIERLCNKCFQLMGIMDPNRAKRSLAPLTPCPGTLQSRGPVTATVGRRG